jgi:CheY-like chemotaxis protein
MSRSQITLRIFYLEDNPLIVLHVQSMIEDLGHIFVGSLSSFAELQACIDQLEMDGALIDIDLIDGPTGPAAAGWLLERGIPSIFVTGQEQAAAQYASVSLGVIGKPVGLNQLAEKLELFKLPKN